MADTLTDTLRTALTKWAREFLPKAGARIAGRAVGSYMRDAKGEPRRRKPGDTGPLRIVSGRLARSLTGSRFQGAVEAYERLEQVADLVFQYIKGTLVPYARAQEKGFRGAVTVRAHRRRRGQGDPYTVRTHTRNMVIAERAYLEPAFQDELPALQKLAEADLRRVLGDAFRGFELTGGVA